MNHSSQLAQKISLFVLLLMLAGCSVGPKYIPPIASVPASWRERKNNSSGLNEEAWWRNFHDQLLNGLIEHHAVYNLDLKTAQARINAARADYALAAAQLFPTVSGAALPPSGTGATINQLIALSTALEPDLFGKFRQNKQRTSAHLNVEEAESNFALINLYAEIATAYLELREAQAKEDNLHHNISGNKQLFQFLRDRCKQGLTNYMNVAQQEALIETQHGELEQNKALIIAILHKIELLTGNHPGKLAKELLPHRPVPQITQEIHLGITS
ncbi:MAG: TolC family protein [Legionella sp.]